MAFIDNIDSMLTALSNGQIKDIGSLNSNSMDILSKRADSISGFYNSTNPLTSDVGKVQSLLQTASEVCEQCSKTAQDAMAVVSGPEAGSRSALKNTAVKELRSKGGRKLFSKVENAILDKATQPLQPYMNSEYGKVMKTVMTLYGYNTKSDKALIEDVLHDMAAKAKDMDIKQAANDASLKQRQIDNTTRLDYILWAQGADTANNAAKMSVMVCMKARSEWEAMRENIKMGKLCNIMKQMKKNSDGLKAAQDRLAITSLMDKFQRMDFSTASAIAKTVSNNIPNYQQLAVSKTNGKSTLMDDTADGVAESAISNRDTIVDNNLPTREQMTGSQAALSNANMETGAEQQGYTRP